MLINIVLLTESNQIYFIEVLYVPLSNIRPVLVIVINWP